MKVRRKKSWKTWDYIADQRGGHHAKDGAYDKRRCTISYEVYFAITTVSAAS